MKAAKKFDGVLRGGFKTFRPGDLITKKEAQELGLSDKPDLVKKERRRAKSSKA